MSTVITFDPFGDAQTTRNRGSISRIFSGMFSDIQMERITEIRMDSKSRSYFIEWRLGCTIETPSGSMYELCAGDHSDITLHCAIFTAPLRPSCMFVDPDTGRLHFREYEDAVSYEVACLNELRRKGITF